MIDTDRAALPDPSGVGQWARLYLSSAVDGLRHPPPADIERYCFFVGYARSGHSLVGSLLNAHPEVVISHELDAVRFVRHGFRRSQLFSLILRRDQAFGATGRSWSGYDYQVPDQFQGRHTRLRVIGDKRGRSTTMQLGRKPELLDRLRRVVDLPIRVVHVTRDPFDNIAAEVRRRSLTVPAATAWYEEMCRSVRVIRPLLGADELLDVRYETFTADPAAGVRQLCEFAGVAAADEYVAACASAVFPSTTASRDAVSWSADERREVERIVETYDALAWYGAGDHG